MVAGGRRGAELAGARHWPDICRRTLRIAGLILWSAHFLRAPALLDPMVQWA